MKKRYTDEQIIAFLKQAEAGMPIKELCRKHGFSDASFYLWRRRFGGMSVPDAKRLRELESENAKLKKLLAEALLDADALRVVARGKFLSPQARREAVSIMRAKTDISERRACALLGLSRTVLHYTPQPRDEGLQKRLIELAGERRRFGYRRLHILLEREGFEVNHKRVHRLYRLAGLAVRRRRKRDRVAVERRPLLIPSGPNHTWSMDFVFDALADGRPIKCLTVVDDCTKEAIEIAVAKRINGQGVADILDAVCRFRGYPAAIRTDQGPEFTGRSLDQWAHANDVKLILIQPGKPTQNAYIESFNGKFRDECLNEHWFTSVDHAKALIAIWRRDYNEVRPHSAIGNRTPAQFAQTLREQGVLSTNPSPSDMLETKDSA
ncbi:MAG: IS3 family transposase [Rhodanobacteraceae bacterium]